eukprot:CAMPEP_0170454522 /NCGR_PEP_ID=MMETSP0123-20130129/2749_1 /TAXON_ID=182087 /ORGANISM="Favella ehrenbergii, Strain Fehren 1" /LENGTH=97 /DNA_ID=CAMNT_0010717269 /DNA_START=421 /DNA_END=714 /DNA_ORIENTATION=-
MRSRVWHYQSRDPPEDVQEEVGHRAGEEAPARAPPLPAAPRELRPDAVRSDHGEHCAALQRGGLRQLQREGARAVLGVRAHFQRGGARQAPEDVLEG